MRSWSSLGGGDGGSRESTRILPADVVKTGYLKKLKVEIDRHVNVYLSECLLVLCQISPERYCV